jgi:hypothetical protein
MGDAASAVRLSSTLQQKGMQGVFAGTAAVPAGTAADSAGGTDGERAMGFKLQHQLQPLSQAPQMLAARKMR